MKKKRNLKQKVMVLLVLSLTLLGFCTSCSKGKSAEGVELRGMTWNKNVEVYRKVYDERFKKEHPGVTIEFTIVTVDQFKNSIVSLIKSGDAPDIFPVPTGMSLAAVVEEGWFTELDPYMNKKFLSTIRPENLIEDVAYVNGKMYAMPFQGPLNGSMVFYNKTLLEEAGVDKVPETYSEFREACKKVTEAGKGKYYGLIEGAKQVNRLEGAIRALAGLAGGKISITTATPLMVDGEATYYAPEVRGAFELYAQLAEDGSLHPDSVSLSALEARDLFAQGVAAFICTGSFSISMWAQNNPDFTNYGITTLPKPDGYTGPSAISAQHLTASAGVYAQSKNKELAAEYLKGMYSADKDGYQAACVSAGGFDSVVKGVNERYMKENPMMLEYYTKAVDKQAIQPNPVARGDALIGKFYAEVKTISPNIGTILQGIFANSIKKDEWDGYLKKCAEDTTKEWKRAAEAVGMDISLLEFPNWVVGEDYTQDKYEELKK